MFALRATPKTIGRSMGAFFLVVFCLPIAASFWLDSLTIDGFALILFCITGGITNKRSVRCAVLCQIFSGLYAFAYGTLGVIRCFTASGFQPRPEVEVPLLLRVVAVPVLLGVAVWGFWNAVAINRFVKGITMPEPAAEDEETVAQTAAVESP